MLSILIPIYNYDVRDFVTELSLQASKLSCHVQILCLDDASETHFRHLNKAIESLPHVHFIQSETNLGRSKVRNELAKHAQFEHLLFLDCDGKCVSDQYLSNYQKAWDDYDVIYGGRVYDDVAPDDHELYFHWYCGSMREAKLVENRRLEPFKSFMTNNFLIRKSTYDAIKMDEEVVGYGHEDTLFAQELKRCGFKVSHIDNPIKHMGLEPFKIFMLKSENGVRNLHQLIKTKKVDKSIKLVRFYQLFARLRFLGLIAGFVSVFRKEVFKNLQGPAPNLVWFDLWKLSILYRCDKGFTESQF